MARFLITRAESGKKLPRFLRQWQPGIPLSAIYKALRTGRVRVNGARGKLDTVLCEGDTVEWAMADDPANPRLHTAQKPAEPGGHRTRTGANKGVSLDVIYEDANLLVLNKPAGLLTHNDRPGEQDTLVVRALRYLSSRDEKLSEVVRPATVNRLDRNTSGLVLIGKNGPALRELNEWIRKRRIHKEYLTIVEGRPPRTGELRGALTRDFDNRTTRVVNGGKGLPALTRFRTLDTRNGYSLVEVELVTGRTHQIRAHFAAAGHPLLGDAKYGGRPAAGYSRPLLHAFRITLPDGRTFNAPLPANFKQALQQLGLKVADQAPSQLR